MTTYTAPTQHALGSGFNAASTSTDVMNGIVLTSRTAIVTGGYSGLGLETVRALAAAGARVIVPARDLDRARASLAGITGAEIWPMDLLAPSSIDAFAQRYLAEGKPLDLLILSAGIMALPTRELDARGLELQFATNHVGHFQLTGRLWPALAAATQARVVSVSSRGHRFSPVVFDDLNFEQRPYDRWAAYGQSKTANVLFALELDRRAPPSRVRAFSVHPGGILGTNLARHIDRDELIALGALDAAGQPIIDPGKGMKTVEQGAATQLWCATSPRLNPLGGLYCEDVEVAELIDEPAQANWHRGDGVSRNGVYAHAVDPEAARRLWDLSVALTGVQFP
mgnify:CR=1 FL=1